MSKAVMQQALEALEKCSDWPGAYDACSRAVDNLRAALAEPEHYAAQNPLGGPAKVFDAMADAIRSGDDYHATLRRYGFAEVKAPQPEQEPVAWLAPRTVDSYMRPDLGYETCSKTDYAAFPVYTAPTPQPEPPVAFLADAMRFKVTLTQHDCKITNLPRELGGRWVALVAAEDDCHMKLAAPTPQREHITDGSPCWCNPDVIEEDGGNVIVHNYEDNWQQYAKPGETAQQCIERHRSEQDALMKLYATPRKPLTDEELEPLLGALPCYDIGNSDLINFARAVIAAYEAKQGKQT